MKLLPFIVALFLLPGCFLIPKKPQSQVQTQTTAQISNTTHRLETIGALSVGVEATIPKSPDVALSLNKKVMTLAEEPTPAQVKMVMDSIDNAEAKEVLEKRVGELIEEKRKVAEKNNQLINTLANQNASLTEQKHKAEEELSTLRNPFYAIWFGIKTLVMRSIYILSGLTIVFFVLRAFAASNPVVGAVFSVLEHIVAFVIKGVVGLFPKSVAFSGHLPKQEYNRHLHTLKVLIDSIEVWKVRDEVSGKELLSIITKNADEADKEVIKSLK